MTAPISLRRKEQPQQTNPSESFNLKPKNSPLSLKKKEIQPKEQEFQSFEEDEREEERARAQLTSRMIETILGAPGDIASFGAGLFGKKQNILPTSHSLREKSESLSQGYTTPKNEFEERTGELASDIASMALPGAKGYSLARNIGIPAVANLVKEGLKYNDAEEKNQAYGKVGTMIALDLMSGKKGGVTKHLSNIFNKAETLLPEGLSVNASKLEKSLETLEKELSRGGTRPSTSKALEKVGELKKDIKNGKIDIKTLAAYRPSINEAIDELGGFSLAMPYKYRKAAIHNLNGVKSEIIKNMTEYGEKFNPEFLKHYQSANEGFAALKQSNVIGNLIRDKIPFIPKSKAVETLFGYAPLTAIGGLALKGGVGAATGGTAALGLYQGHKILNRVKNSPTLRKYYGNVLKEASEGNIPQTTKNLKALDAAFEREED